MKIYLAAFPLGIGSGRVPGSSVGGDVLGVALAEDGTGLGEHLSSSLQYAKHDLGLTSTWKHDRYRKHAPAGYVLEWVDNPKTHAGWIAALTKNKARLDLQRKTMAAIEHDWIASLDAMLEDRVSAEIAIEVRRLIAAYQQQQGVLTTVAVHLEEVYAALGEALNRLKAFEEALTR